MKHTITITIETNGTPYPNYTIEHDDIITDSQLIAVLSVVKDSLKYDTKMLEVLK